MKDVLIKGVLLLLIFLAISKACEYEKQVQAIRHKKFERCVETKVMSPILCSLHVQFSPDEGDDK